MFTPRSTTVLWVIVCLVHTATTATGCRADREDAPAPGAEAAIERRAERPEGASTAHASTTDSTEGPADSADGSDSIVATIEVCRSERADGPAELPREELVEVRSSIIPGAGDGLFARVDITADTYLGDYMGRYLTEEEVEALPEFESIYLFEFPRYAGTTYDSIAGDPQHYVSKVNFAPSELNGGDTDFQNVRWESFCDEPYVRLYSARDIAAGEELYVDYGSSYDYEFMEHPRVQEFFLALLGETFEDGFAFEYSGRP